MFSFTVWTSSSILALQGWSHHVILMCLQVTCASTPVAPQLRYRMSQIWHLMRAKCCWIFWQHALCCPYALTGIEERCVNLRGEYKSFVGRYPKLCSAPFNTQGYSTVSISIIIYSLPTSVFPDQDGCHHVDAKQDMINPPCAKEMVRV